jgi:hypothetical protein
MAGKMDLARVRKKLAEAEFFLNLMIAQEPQIFANKEPFDYYLSAFLNAARTVDYRLRHEQGVIYKPWRGAWDATLSPSERGLMKFIDDDRRVEVHDSGSSRNVAREGVVFPIGTHQVSSGILTISGPPGMQPAVGYRPTYSFTIDGADRKVTEACAEHLTLLRRMVAQFEADHP